MAKKGGPHHLVFPSGARLRLDYYPFLGKQLCRKAFRTLTTVDPWRAKRAISQGKCVLLRKKYTRSRRRHDEMLGAIHSVAQDMHLQSPYAHASERDPLVLHVPFHHHVVMWRLILQMYESGKLSFIRTPTYSLFRKVLVLPDVRDKIRFHRIVEIGRCPKCKYFEWKCSSVAPELRHVWQDAWSKHHVLQIAQKKCFVADRAKAMVDYPRTEMYMSMDCGSGQDFVLPHVWSCHRWPNQAVRWLWDGSAEGVQFACAWRSTKLRDIESWCGGCNSKSHL